MELREERERVEDALMKEMILKKNTVRTSVPHSTCSV